MTLIKEHFSFKCKTYCYKNKVILLNAEHYIKEKQYEICILIKKKYLNELVKRSAGFTTGKFMKEFNDLWSSTKVYIKSSTSTIHMLKLLTKNKLKILYNLRGKH